MALKSVTFRVATVAPVRSASRVNEPRHFLLLVSTLRFAPSCDFLGPSPGRNEPFLAAGIPTIKMLAVETCEELPLESAKTGDPAAWSAIFQRFRLPVYVYVFELVRNRQDALDLVQETFLNAVRHLSTLRDDARFASWLFSIAHQRCLRHFRRSHRRESLFVDPEGEAVEEVADGAEEPQEWLIRKERQEEFLASLAQLPPPQRSVLLLHFMEDFSLEEIAGVTGVPLGTVKSRLFNAKRGLKRLIEEDKT
jgi:RNA polymerase sigma-70 factor (ECF subfamily)